MVRRLFQIFLVAYGAMLLGLVFMETRLVYPGAFLDSRGGSTDVKASLVPRSFAEPASALAASGESASVGARVERGVNVTGVTPQISIQTIEYPSTDDLILRGRLLERGGGKEIVLFFHGNGIKVVWLDNWIRQLSATLDANVMAAEYRGFADEVTPTEQGVVADSLAARDYLCERFGVTPRDIILYGESLGGGCAAAVASVGGAKVLVLERTFDRMTDVAAGMYPFVPVRWLMRNQYDSVARLKNYDGPLIMIHGTADRLIPIEHGRNLFDSVPSRQKHWIEVPEVGHNDPFPQNAIAEMASTLRHFVQAVPFNENRD